MLHQALHVEVRLVLQVLRHRVNLLALLVPCPPQVYLLFPPSSPSASPSSSPSSESSSAPSSSVRKSIQQSLEQPEYLTFRYSIRRTEFFAVKRGIVDFPEIIAIKRTIELTIKLAVCESIVGTIEQSQFFAIKLTV